MDLSGGDLIIRTTPFSETRAIQSTETPLTNAAAVNESTQIATIDPTRTVLEASPAESSYNFDKYKHDLTRLLEVDQASGNESPIVGKRQPARTKVVKTPGTATSDKKETTPKSKDKRKGADEKYKPKKQFTQLAAKIRRSLQDFPLGTFRVWSGSTYPENTLLELTYNAIQSLRRGLKTTDHPKFDETHEKLGKIIDEAEESGSYNDAHKEIHKLIEGLSMEPKKTASTRTPKRKPTSTKKRPNFFSDSDKEDESEVEIKSKKRFKVEIPVVPKVNKDFERMKKRVDRAVDRLKKEIMDMVEDMLG
jgi:hypothetical protein